MNEIIEVQTSELTGEALAWSVAKAEGLTVFIADPQYGNPYRVMVHLKREGKLLPQQERFKPQVEWSQGGPLIEKYKVLLTPPTGMVHRNFGNFDSRNGWYESGMWGSTIFVKDRKHRRTAFHHPDSPLIAAMRAIVQFELGDTVQVPKILLP